MIVQVIWKRQAKQERKTNNEKVPGRIHIDVLQIREPHGRDHTKHHHEHSTDNRVWDSGEQSAKFCEDSDSYHEHRTTLNHTQTANLSIIEIFFFVNYIPIIFSKKTEKQTDSCIRIIRDISWSCIDTHINNALEKRDLFHSFISRIFLE